MACRSDYEDVPIGNDNEKIGASCDLDCDENRFIVRLVREAWHIGKDYNLPIDTTANGTKQELQRIVDQDYEQIKDMLAEQSAAIWEDE